jgi:NAD(P)H-dependent FMN reductase
MVRAMPESPVKLLAVSGSLHHDSVTRIIIRLVATKSRSAGCAVDLLDLQAEPLPLYSPDTAYDSPGFRALQKRVERADVLILGTPDYHGSISSALKNFLDHFWHEFTGKLFVPLVASHEKGLTVVDQLRTVARQCYAWTLPYAVSFSEDDLKKNRIVNDSVRKRLEMMVRDARVYGRLLARQRRTDLAGKEPGFLARLRE